MMEDERTSHTSERRVHAWVLVCAGRRDVRETMFIESSTGRVYTARSCPFIAVEFVWNHLNFFINSKIDMSVAEVTYSTNGDVYLKPVTYDDEC
jgi:hypothetical protein